MEGCDDGNSIDTDGCREMIALSRFAETALSTAGVEVCDDGNRSDEDACLNNCKAAKCGDGFIQANVEACDDGNNDDTDGCNDALQPRAMWRQPRPERR